MHNMIFPEALCASTSSSPLNVFRRPPIVPHFSNVFLKKG